MDFFELIQKRHSIRAFQEKPVEEEKIRKILEAANRAPSAGNLQAYKITVVKNPKIREKVSQAFYGRFKKEAPLLLVFWADPKESASCYGERGAKLYALQDATIAATFALLAIEALGLATVWVGAFEDEAVKEALGKTDLVPVAIFPVGYGAEKPGVTDRKSLDKIREEI